MTGKHHLKSHKHKSKSLRNKTGKKCKCKKRSGGDPTVQPEKPAGTGMFSFMPTSYSNIFPSSVWPFSSSPAEKAPEQPPNDQKTKDKPLDVQLNNNEENTPTPPVIPEAPPTKNWYDTFKPWGGDITQMNNYLPPTKQTGGKKKRCKTSKKTNAVKGNK
jgi:hypothetical protein